MADMSISRETQLENVLSAIVTSHDRACSGEVERHIDEARALLDGDSAPANPAE